MNIPQWHPGTYEPGKHVQFEGWAYERNTSEMMDCLTDYPPASYGKCWRNLGRVDHIEALIAAQDYMQWMDRYMCEMYGTKETALDEQIRTALRGIVGEEETA